MSKEKTAKIIGDNLKRIRKKHNMTQKEFSDYIGMTNQNLSQTERGVYKPGLDKILEIAEILEVTPNELLLEPLSEDYFKGRKAELNSSLQGLVTYMETFEPYRAEAEVARREGDEEKELKLLHKLVNHLAWTNDHWRDIANFVYYKKLDSLVKKTSNGYQD
ncbi:helix-turn-helix transcriptional regulator, partial [Enterococcus faecalis]|nr:helix-turn-helix transcriptional regulator [Enterococcus faecalis]